jgi:hypothetical protein
MFMEKWMERLFKTLSTAGFTRSTLISDNALKNPLLGMQLRY